MDMSMDNLSSSSSSTTLVPLNDSGVDFSNFTQAFNFQQEILDDTILQIIANGYATDFWYGIVVVIGIATIFNVTWKVLLQMRIRAAAANRARPASARSAFTKILGGVTAICREATYPQYSPAKTYRWLKVPPFGIMLLLVSYLAFILALEFNDNNIDGAQHYTSLGVRASWLAVSQIPLLLLLAGKANLIGALVGVSYERLNVLHRWVSRSILLCITLHFGYQSYGWNLYGLMQLEWDTDTCPLTGIAAYSLLLWLNLTSLAPIRNRFYEIFVIQHIISFIAFIYLVMAHIPSTALYARTYVYVGVGIYFLDRLIRTIRYAYNNIRPGRASLTALDGGVTLVRVQSKQIKSWAPGSHVLLSIPRLGFGQSHPATVISVPSSHNGDLVFILKCHKGFTSRILKSATISQTSQKLPDSKPESAVSSASAAPEKTYIALIGGPYGASNSDPAAFDTVLLISGSTGVTFMISNLLSLAHRAQTTANNSRLPLRRVDFVWVIKQACWTSWIADELGAAVRDLQARGVDANVKIYVTCDDSFTHIPPRKAEEERECTCEDECNCCDAPDPNPDDAITFSPSAEAGARREEAEEAKKPVTTTVTATEIAERRQLPFATFVCGRPDMTELVWELASQAEGEMGIFACGPLGMCTEMRRTVARVSDDRAVCMGTGAEGIYLHVESFAW
jgi:ferric-chelate reductase